MLIGAGVSEENKRLLVFGLTKDDVNAVLAGHSLRVTRRTHGEAVPADLAVVILYGRTEADLEAIFAPHVAEPPPPTQ